MNAVEHAKLQTQAKMTDTIFLEPVTSPVQKTVFIQVKNTSDVPLEFGNFLQMQGFLWVMDMGAWLLQEPAHSSDPVSA